MKNIDNCALKLGIDPSMSGYEKFVEAVNLHLQNSGKLTLNKICKTIGSKHSMNGKAVMREIDYALKKARDINANLQELTGRKIYDEDIRPKYVICLVAKYIAGDNDEKEAI